jgi:FKBP-type peptidyl-prolyl cis-trans isomerase
MVGDTLEVLPKGCRRVHPSIPQSPVKGSKHMLQQFKSRLVPTLLLATAAGLAPACADAQGAPAGELETVEQKASYSIGFNLGSSLAQNQVEADIDALVQGLRDGLLEATSKLTDQEMQAAMMEVQQRVQATTTERQSREGADNQAKGAAFLAENGKRSEVKTTASGLQYEVLTEGSGAKPTATSTVEVHYHGTTIDGTVFDSSVNRGQPISFPLNGVIPGWTEGVQLMPVGSKYKFFIPSELGYGANSPPGAKFGPNSVLIFEVELLDIKS